MTQQGEDRALACGGQLEAPEGHSPQRECSRNRWWDGGRHQNGLDLASVLCVRQGEGMRVWPGLFRSDLTHNEASEEQGAPAPKSEHPESPTYMGTG